MVGLPAASVSLSKTFGKTETSRLAGCNEYESTAHYSAAEMCALLGCEYPDANPDRAPKVPVECLDRDRDREKRPEYDRGDERGLTGPEESDTPVCGVYGGDVPSMVCVILMVRLRRVLAVCERHKTPAAVIAAAARRATGNAGVSDER